MFYDITALEKPQNSFLQCELEQFNKFLDCSQGNCFCNDGFVFFKKSGPTIRTAKERQKQIANSTYGMQFNIVTAH